MKLDYQKAVLDSAWETIEPFVQFACLVEDAGLEPIDLDFQDLGDGVIVGSHDLKLNIGDYIIVKVTNKGRYAISRMDALQHEVYAGKTSDESLPQGAIDLLECIQRVPSLRI